MSELFGGQIASSKPASVGGSQTQVPILRVTDCLPSGSEQPPNVEFFFDVRGCAERPTRYVVWYNQIIGRAKRRGIPRCYTELHHIKPRSMGGGDEEENLVRLTYREHFLAHWLLTKICTGGDLRRMQRAMMAMTLKCSGERIVSGWQFEAAKRAVRDLELDPVAEAMWREKYSKRQQEKIIRAQREEVEFLRFGRNIARAENRQLIESVVTKHKLTKDALKAAASLYLGPNGKRGWRSEMSREQISIKRSRSVRSMKTDSVRKKHKQAFSAILNEPETSAKRWI